MIILPCLLAASKELKSIKAQIDRSLKESISQFDCLDSLKEVILYSLSGPGKRIRPILVFLTANALGFDLDVLPAALSVEYFHTASLIADDLPCMDNDMLRRDRLALHYKYGETDALLASYGLIAEGFKKIEENGRLMQKAKEPFCINALEAMATSLNAAASNAGFSGATSGQYEDLKGKGDSIQELERIIYLKTITLFEGSFIMGWSFGGGDLSKIKEIKEIAYFFGRAFQIRDDFYDVKQDLKKDRPMNYALALGKEEAKAQFERDLSLLEEKLKALSIYSPLFAAVLSRLSDLN